VDQGPTDRDNIGGVTLRLEDALDEIAPKAVGQALG